MVFQEIKNYGHDSTKKQLIAGVVLTGGGAQLKHLKQLVEYITGMDTRVGYPNEHLAGDSDPETTSPLYATAVGLLMDGLENFEKEKQEAFVSKKSDPIKIEKEPVNEKIEEEELEPVGHFSQERTKRSITAPKIGIFERWATKFKEFLDNAE